MNFKLFGYLPLAMFAVLSLTACGDTDGANDATDTEQVGDNNEQTTLKASEAQKDLEVGTPEYTDIQERAAALRQQIRDIVKMPNADNIQQCKFVGVGHRPCGGPESYTLYSTKNTDEDALLPVVEEYNQLRKAIDEKEGMVSTCEVLPKPGISLNGGVCMPVKSAEM